ncbi:hypothetical protein BGP77_13150 [Saccharospirillum sp. MSK14-1]|uniref:DUF294 nucleotidyltransferase-like domain-containing protein n=1 Tax=Saccharospirillum sp. MSK14-1 TaxID=1897632 RepID=UPI000D37A0B3|nr:DUF294 nucleotidyltransferase-like domain-containing protein [Saccharospirillum sp. MSK14-1]PTY37445.1 hypothetical protein BGP77_13150 [Saccharospirillum sp. MSK14-1]
MSNADDLKDVVDFLAETLPFSALPAEDRLDVAQRLSVDYIPRHANQPLALAPTLYIIRTGAFELRTADGELLDRLGEHDLFGINTLLNGNPEGLTVYPIEDALVYKLSSEAVKAFSAQYEPMGDFFQQVSSQRNRLNRLARNRQSKPRLETQLTQSVRDVITADATPVGCVPTTSIQQAAQLMRDERVSSLMLLDGDVLGGIVTDRDIRNRVVAEGLDLQLPVSNIATTDPIFIDAGALLFDAQKMMSQHRVHHLPVMEQGRVIGMITATDLVRAQQVSPLFLIDDIQRQNDLDSLSELRHRIPALIHNWVQADISPVEMGRVLAAIGDAFVQRCIALAQQELGDAPMRFAWLAFGSQARMDQTFASDQDNALILEREPNQPEADYFRKLANWVCPALAKCGYVLCPGDIMASNPQWRLSVADWQARFNEWVDAASPKTLLNSSIFFDLRVIDGDADLLAPVQKNLLARTPKADLFLALMTQTAVRNRPPLGFFRRFVVESGGAHEDALDLKHRGVALINDLARIHALAGGLSAVGTHARLQAAMDAGLLEADAGHSLMEAWHLIAALRIEEQSEAVRRGEKPTSFLDPDALSPLTRAHLKDAFGTIQEAQQMALNRYARGQYG